MSEEFQTHQFALGYSETEWKEELTYVKRVKGSDIQNKQSEFCCFGFFKSLQYFSVDLTQCNNHSISFLKNRVGNLPIF